MISVESKGLNWKGLSLLFMITIASNIFKTLVIGYCNVVHIEAHGVGMNKWLSAG